MTSPRRAQIRRAVSFDGTARRTPRAQPRCNTPQRVLGARIAELLVRPEVREVLQKEGITLDTYDPSATPRRVSPRSRNFVENRGARGSTRARTVGPRELRQARRQALQELQPCLELIREKAPKKFSHVREALRPVATHYDGKVDRQQVRSFFRSFDLDGDTADSFFWILANRAPQASYSSFLKHIGPYLDLPGADVAMQSVGWGSRADRGARNELWYTPRGASPISPKEVQHCREQAAHLGLRQETPRQPSSSKPTGRRPLNASRAQAVVSPQLTCPSPELRQSPEWAATVAAETDVEVQALVQKEGSAAMQDGSGVAQALMAGGRPLARPFGQPRSPAPHRGRMLMPQQA